DVQPAVGELSGGPAVEERRVVGERRRRLVGAHLGAHAPRVVALAHPARAVDLDAPAVELEPAAVATELLGACHVLGDAAVAPAGVGWPVYQSRSIHAGSLLSIWSKVVGNWWPIRSSWGVNMGLANSNTVAYSLL